ncbi:MAG TPA: CRTAC1 family protein [Planctomycetes bacterium]|nr:CRTAC1 family protein [Fuerstiella sp.]HIK95663.1 CRTAC1 family protein [Planctomycetota bacterium]
MTQPLDQQQILPALGELDDEAGEFWLDNPWNVGDNNLSAFERNRIMLNTTDGRFVDVSSLTGADIDSDTRSVVAADLTADGMPELIYRSSGGGPLRIFENRWPQQNWMRVSLRGRQSNSRGIGARLTVDTGDQTLSRELFPVSSFRSQMPSTVNFGLGDSTLVRRLTIYWPSGIIQEFENLPVNRHIRIAEDESSSADLISHVLSKRASDVAAR